MEHTQDEITQRLDMVEARIDAMQTSIEKAKKYLRILLWVTVAMTVIPAVGLAIVIPVFLNSYLGALDGLL